MDSLAALSIIAAVITPVFVVVAVGFVWGRRSLPFDNTFISTFVVSVATPCLAFSALTRTGASIGELSNFALAVVACIGGNILVGYLLTKVLRLAPKTYLTSFAFPNAGNMGYPMVLFAFGDKAAAYAVVFFTCCSLLQFIIGPMLVAGRVTFSEFLRTPQLHSVLVALVFVAFMIAVPDWLANTTKLIGDCSIPLMLVALGVALAKLRLSRGDAVRLAALSLLRCATGFVVGVTVAWLFGLEGIEKGSIILQNSMPIAIFNYIWAMRYDNDPQSVAGMVVASTILSVVTTPMVLLYVLAG